MVLLANSSAQAHHFPMSLSREHADTKAAEAHHNVAQQCLNWIRQARRLAKKLHQDLSKTVDACERFSDKYSVTFQDFSRTGRLKSLSALQGIFDELIALKTTLGSMAVRCEAFARDVSVRRKK
jgi:hypothetical protein